MQPLVIAAGTFAELTVTDVRGDYTWAHPSDWPLSREVFYHHTVDTRATSPTATVAECVAAMKAMADSDKYRLPYNFLVFPNPAIAPFYLNDVDQAWPHTYGNNGAVAIAAQGNYDVAAPPPDLAHRMGQVTLALGEMWQLWLRERFHRDVFPTACPGRYLAAALIADGSYSG